MPPEADALPVDWSEVLDRVSQTLTQAEEAGLRAEAILPTAADSADDAWQEVLNRLGTGGRRLEQCVAQAGAAAAQAEASLEASEAALRGWLEHAAALSTKLANQSSRTVS